MNKGPQLRMRLNATAGLAYVSQMNLAQQAWEHSDIARMDEFLENQIPKPNQTDLRGFEWYYLWRLGHQDRWSRQIIGSRVSVGFYPMERSLQ